MERGGIVAVRVRRELEALGDLDLGLPQNDARLFLARQAGFQVSALRPAPTTVVPTTSVTAMTFVRTPSPDAPLPFNELVDTVSLLVRLPTA